MSDCIPIPVGWKVIIEPVSGKTMTDAGIDVSATVEAQEHLQYLGKLVAVGEAAFKAETKGGINMLEWEVRPQVGDHVLFTPYSGMPIRRVKRSDGKARPTLILMNDTDIHAVVDDPNNYYSWVEV